MHRFKCRSWRHEGECRQWKGAQDFTRIREALASRSAWLYLVNGFDQGELPDLETGYRDGGRRWNRLRSALHRRWGKIEYVQTWEQHKTGYPHLNTAIYNKRMLDYCTVEGCDHVKRVGRSVRLCDGYAQLRREYRELAERAGFGRVLWLEPVRDQERMAGYLVKLAREITGAAQKDQTPTRAPRHFRRLRASRGLLPKVHKNEAITGELRKASYERVAAELAVKKNSHLVEISYVHIQPPSACSYLPRQHDQIRYSLKRGFTGNARLSGLRPLDVAEVPTADLSATGQGDQSRRYTSKRTGPRTRLQARATFR